MKYLSITYPDLENGCGCRVTLWVSGCSHHCIECHNPETWDYDSGQAFTTKSYQDLKEVLSLPYIEGLTLSGGDPLYKDNARGILTLCEKVKADFPTKDIWLYTGYTWEQILKNPALKEVLDFIDVLVEGPYVKELRDISLAFRGSSNQRIVDVKQSLKENKLILWD